jgi:phosphoglucosamine mutase
MHTTEGWLLFVVSLGVLGLATWGLRTLESQGDTEPLSSEKLSRLAECFTPSPQAQINVAVREKRPLEGLATVRLAIAEVEKVLGGDGRVLVRFSGTENKARVLVEGPDAVAIRGHAERIADALRRELA